jgi:hypothetical protein
MNSSLNHVYRIVWNASLGMWQVASEISRGKGKTQSTRRSSRLKRSTLAATIVALGAPPLAMKVY